MSRTTHHMGVSLTGIIRQDGRSLRRFMKGFSHDDGKPFTSVSEFRSALTDLVSSGVLMIPIGEKCEGWSDKTGCPGHSCAEEEPAVVGGLR